MRFSSFEITNFKGIAHTKLDLYPFGSNIFTLIGLNESGKTTILEALSTFSIHKEETGVLYGADNLKVEPVTYVPKHLKANFTGDITVKATVVIEDAERDEIVSEVYEDIGAKLNIDSVPKVLEVIRGYKFENSDYTKSIYTVNLEVRATEKGKRKEVSYNSSSAVWKAVYQCIVKRIPRIVYFPTFLFTQPDKIILNPGKNETPVNKHYRKIISDVAGSLKHPLDVQKHIVDRIVNEETITQKIYAFWGLAPDKQAQIEAVLNQMSANLTETVFKNWSKIFGGDFSGREIVLKPGIQVPADGQQEVYLQFALKDGVTHYDISERSLGFRWFFSFLLFTLYRVSNQDQRPTLFLLDEPASNLHSKAQMQLLESLPKISVGSNQIIYSTHSHYLINPEWLDQAFIVSNQSIDYDRLDDGNRMLNDTPASVNVDRYRNFVGRYPDKTTYFQPVLDKLDVTPSRLDLMRPSILVEGKADYLLLEYGRKVLLSSESVVSIVPTRGAMGMEELIGIFLGWGIPFVICLDDDQEGRSAQKKYIQEWGMDVNKVKTLADVHGDLVGKSIEGFLQDEDLLMIARHFQIEASPTKSQIQLFFSEKLAKRETVNISAEFKDRIVELERKIEQWIKK